VVEDVDIVAVRHHLAGMELLLSLRYMVAALVAIVGNRSSWISGIFFSQLGDQELASGD
jgi:hypothetical protein